MIETVRGPIPSGSLGRTLMHEHVFVREPEIAENLPDTWDDESFIEQATCDLEKLYEAGIDTILDATVIGLGRSVKRLCKIARRTRINILVGTGIYTFDRLPRYFQNDFRDGHTKTIDTLRALFAHDIEDGIAATGVKATFLKCASEADTFTSDLRLLMTAICEAHIRTGSPIITHSNPHAGTGEMQQKFFAQRGVDLTRVVVGHCGDTTNMEYLSRIAECGSYLSMDRFGIDDKVSLNERVDTIIELIDRGFGNQIVISHDTASYTDFLPPEERWRRPDWHYTFISQKVIPLLLSRGVTSKDINRILIDNPRRIFCPEDFTYGPVEPS